MSCRCHTRAHTTLCCPHTKRSTRGSGLRSVARLREECLRLVFAHEFIHASWLNQIEIYFSIMQRKILTPNDGTFLAAAVDYLLGVERHYERLAMPLEWAFTHRDLAALVQKLVTYHIAALQSAA